MIKEIVVVEGKDDLCAVKNAVEAEVIITGGLGLNGRTLELIREAKERRGVIIFTDPDFAGEKIRDMISGEISGCRHAFLTKSEATGKDGRLGVENADPGSIRKALSFARSQEADTDSGEFSMKDLLDAGLTGTAEAQAGRDFVGEWLGIGYGSAKKIVQRLNGFGIPREEFERAVNALEKAGKNDE